MGFDIERNEQNRRAFLKSMALGATALGCGTALAASANAAWTKHIGLELYTVRALLPADYEGVLARLEKIGYTEVEPADPYNHMAPADYKALLARHGMKMFSTHADATDGPDLEKELEAQASMGLKYTAVRVNRPAGAPRPAPTVENAKRRAEQINKHGALLAKHGLKYYIHNHCNEFDLLDDAKTTEYDVLLKETDPKLVAMQLDIGWAYVGGQDAIEMFKRNPGRYELWHVKDAKYKHLDAKMTPTQRQRAGKIVTMGEGDIDYAAVFAHAKTAGLKHFVIEQDTAGQGGRDAVEDCRIAFDNLKKILG